MSTEEKKEIPDVATVVGPGMLWSIGREGSLLTGTVCIDNRCENPIEVTIREIHPPKIAKPEKPRAFGWALKQMRKGKGVRRPVFADGWYWWMDDNDRIRMPDGDIIEEKELHNLGADLTATDWEIAQ